MTLRNQLKNVKIHNADAIQSYFTRVSQIKEQIESGKRRSEECRSGDSHREWPPRIMGFTHSKNVCYKEEAQLIIREKNMGANEDQALTIQ